MPNRILREAILSSEAVAKLKPAEEVFYRRLMSIVDDYGRHEANLQLLKSKCYPLAEQLKSSDISCWLDACKNAGLVTHYSVGGKSYLEIIKFQQQVRSKSKCPDPVLSSSCVADDAQLITNAHLGVCVFEGVSDNTSASADLFFDVDKQVVRDFKALRKSKKAAITETAVSGIRREAAKAGMTFSDVLVMCCERGWASFKADWMNGGDYLKSSTDSKPPRRKMLGEGSSTNYGEPA